MKKVRKHIPKKVDDQVKVESGHKCGIWNCPEKYGIERHHIDGDPSNNTLDNIIYLCPTHHKMATDGKITPDQCREYKKINKRFITRPQEIVAENKNGIDVEPESRIEKFVFSLGKKYISWRHGSFDIDLTTDYIIFFIIGCVLFIPLIYAMYIVKYSEVLFLVSFVFAVIGVILFLSIAIMMKSRCPECHKILGIRRVKSVETDRKEIGKTDFGTKFRVTYDNTYKCQFCGFIKQKTEQTIENIDSN